MDLSERAATPLSRHPWELARAAFLLDVLDGDGAFDGERPRVLDVGCGDAWFARELLARWRADVHCWDSHFSDEDIAALAHVPGLTAGREPPDTAAGAFDAALLLDVIEHVDDDAAFVTEVVRRVRPGGRVLVTVPAWPALYSAHDVLLQHRRRYTPAACRALLQRAGLLLTESGGFFHGLLVPRGVSVLVERLRSSHRPPASNDGASCSSSSSSGASSSGIAGWRHGEFITALVVGALRLEQRASRLCSRRGVDVPGLSFFALCRVPGPGIEGGE